MSGNPEQSRSRFLAIAPWREDVSSTVVAVQGSAAAALGLYFLFATTHAVGTLSQIVGAYLAIIGILHLGLAAWNPLNRVARPSAMLRRTIGLIAGSVAFFSPWISWVSPQDARLIVAGVLVLSGVIAIAGAQTDRRLRVTRWASSLSGLVEIGIGVGFYVVTDSERPLMNWLGVIMIVAGAVLIGRAILVIRPKEQGATID
jgi:uncharacterized membrane protein HdeD (DUF308 family)